jgi:hypothetical protein
MDGKPTTGLHGRMAARTHDRTPNVYRCVAEFNPDAPPHAGEKISGSWRS